MERDQLNLTMGTLMEWTRRLMREPRFGTRPHSKERGFPLGRGEQKQYKVTYKYINIMKGISEQQAKNKKFIFCY